jgi:hypothetical protein
MKKILLLSLLYQYIVSIHLLFFVYNDNYIRFIVQDGQTEFFI